MHNLCLTIILLLSLSQLAWGKYACDTTSMKGDTAVICSTFSKDGALVAVEAYKNGKLHGKRLSWYTNGQLKRISPYRNGEPVDTSYTYYADGSLHIRGVQDGITIVFTEAGDTLAITPMCHGNICGTTMGWYPDGRPKSIIRYNDSGKKHGLSEEWREDGTRKDSTVYENGDIIEFRDYYENGKLLTHRTQKPVNKDINGVYYDPRGKKTGEIKNGNGVALIYSEDGKSARRVYFENDEVVKSEEVEVK